MYSNHNDFRNNRAQYTNNPYQNEGYTYENSRFRDDGVTMNDYLIGTFKWMAVGLFITFALAVLTAFTGLWSIVYSLYLPLTIAELALVFMLASRVQKMQVGTARMCFFAYAAINGMVMSFYFIVYDLSTLILAFLSAAVYFGLLAMYGATTKRDLSAWGPKLMIGLVALLICSFIGMFTGFSYLMSLLYCGVGLVIFMLLTAYDTQKLYSYYSYYSSSPEMLAKSSIFGALSLYLDFINIFIMLVRLFGSRSSD